MPITYCFVKGCNSTNYKRKGVDGSPENMHFHKFPSDTKLREKWIQSLKENNNQSNVEKISNSTKLCMKHFEKDCYDQFGMTRMRLKPNSIPTIFLHLLEESVQSQTVKEESVQPDLAQPSASFTIRFPDDIKKENVMIMPTIEMQKSIKTLKQSLQKKIKLIKTLQTQKIRQKKKIKFLEALLSDLKDKNILSLDSCNVIRVSNNSKSLLHIISLIYTHLKVSLRLNHS